MSKVNSSTKVTDDTKQAGGECCYGNIGGAGHRGAEETPAVEKVSCAEPHFHQLQRGKHQGAKPTGSAAHSANGAYKRHSHGEVLDQRSSQDRKAEEVHCLLIYRWRRNSQCQYHLHHYQTQLTSWCQNQSQQYGVSDLPAQYWGVDDVACSLPRTSIHTVPICTSRGGRWVPTGLEQPSSVVCNFFLTTTDRKQLLHLFREVIAPECKPRVTFNLTKALMLKKAAQAIQAGAATDEDPAPTESNWRTICKSNSTP